MWAESQFWRLPWFRELQKPLYFRLNGSYSKLFLVCALLDWEPCDCCKNTLFSCIINYLTSWKVHRKIREDTDMAQDSLQCLAQLASLHGPVFPDEGSQVDYLAHFIEGLLNTINGYVCLLSKFRWHLLIFSLDCSISVWRSDMACLFLDVICAYCWIA